MNMAKDYDVDILAYSDDAIISGICPNSYTELEARINSLPICRVENFPAYINFPTNKLLISGEESLTAELEIKLNSHFRKLLNIYRSEPFFLEIMPQNIDKAYTLQKLLSAIGLTADQMICCGDGYNDITMLESAGLGVAMQMPSRLSVKKQIILQSPMTKTVFCSSLINFSDRSFPLHFAGCSLFGSSFFILSFFQTNFLLVFFRSRQLFQTSLSSTHTNDLLLQYIYSENPSVRT